MTFQTLHSRLVDLLNASVQSGELTERGVARRTGFSQPHIHNVLKGKRQLSWQSADALLAELRIDVLTLAGRKNSDG